MSHGVGGVSKVIVLMGTTGIGKSSIAKELVKRLPAMKGELLSADSVKVYKGLRIGAHKVYDLANHVHLYDLVGAGDHFTAQAYCEAASHAAKEVMGRGNTPIFFGGASMYVEWLLFGGGAAPGLEREKVWEIESELRDAGTWDDAILMAEKRGALGCRDLGRNDYYRLARRVALAEQDVTWDGVKKVGYEKPLLPPVQVRGAFVYPQDRNMLYRSLDRRCEKMVADGLLEETAALAASFGGPDKVPRKIATVVGYRQALEFLEQFPDPTSNDFRKFLYTFQAATRNYARRQMTYFRHSDKLRPHLKAVPALPTSESARDVAGILLELFNQSEEEYARDTRWKEAPEPLGSDSLRKYVVKLEVFGDSNNAKFVLERLKAERSRLQVASLSQQQQQQQQVDHRV